MASSCWRGARLRSPSRFPGRPPVFRWKEEEMVHRPFERSLFVLAACILLAGGLTSLAATAQAAGLPRKTEVSPRLGSTADSVFTPAGPGLVLDGGELE